MDYLIQLLNQYNVSGTIAEIGTDLGDGSTGIFLNYILNNDGEFYADYNELRGA